VTLRAGLHRSPRKGTDSWGSGSLWACRTAPIHGDTPLIERTLSAYTTVSNCPRKVACSYRTRPNFLPADNHALRRARIIGRSRASCPRGPSIRSSAVDRTTPSLQSPEARSNRIPESRWRSIIGPIPPLALLAYPHCWPRIEPALPLPRPLPCP
jgi:hypothetical protein